MYVYLYRHTIHTIHTLHTTHTTWTMHNRHTTKKKYNIYIPNYEAIKLILAKKAVEVVDGNFK